MLRRLRAALARGATFREAAQELGRARSTLHDLARRHHLPRRRRGLTREQERRIAALARRGAQGIRRIAALAGVSRNAVARRYHERLRKLIGDSEYAECAPWRCPCGLLLKIRKCVRCQAVKPARTGKALPRESPPASDKGPGVRNSLQLKT